MEIDRLSALTEHLLIDILGRLNDTKEAMKTAVLSKQWRFLWTDLPSISLKNSSRDPDEIERFVSGAHAVAARTKAPLEKLSVSFRYHERFASVVDAWLDSACKSTVKYVDLDLDLDPVYHPGGLRYTLPQAMYSCSTLTRLNLRYVGVAPPVEWRSMTQLTIHDAKLTQEAIDGITAGCPALRRLGLYYSIGFHRLEIGGRAFRYLEVRGCHRCYDGKQPLEISARHMRELKVEVVPPMTTLRLVDVSSLEKARIDWIGDVIGRWPDSIDVQNRKLRYSQELFEKLQRVRSLVLGCYWIQRVVPSMMRDESWRFPESRVEELEIDDSINVRNVYDVLAILESSPSLEKLIIRNRTLREEKIKWDPTVRVDLDHDLSHLKNVEIEINDHSKLPGELSITLAQILLKRAPILEKMVICKKLADEINFLYAASDELIKKCETLLTYPRSSQKAVVEFIDI